ncbi:MAG: Crp/Fnr family transcriptional regulator [Chitinophagaceae bacterium]
MEQQFSVKEIFPGFEQDLIDEVTTHAQLKHYLPEEIVMKTGQNIRSTMLVVSGTIKVFREDDEGNEYLMYYLQPGQACALSLICASRRETSQIMAKAETAAEVLTVPLEQMERWMGQYRSWYAFVIDNYRSRFEELLQTIDQVAFRNMDERLVFYLRKYQTTMKTNILTTSFTEIAQELNSSREVISRLMKKLAERGVVELQKQHVLLKNLNASLT